MSTILTTQISEKTHRSITAFPHISEVWAALFLPEARLFMKMPAQPSAVAASAAPTDLMAQGEIQPCVEQRGIQNMQHLYKNPFILSRDTASKRKM